jgi:hypothetical protein
MLLLLVSFSQVSTGILDMGKLQDLKVVATVEFEDINICKASWEFIAHNFLKSEEKSDSNNFES